MNILIIFKDPLKVYGSFINAVLAMTFTVTFTAKFYYSTTVFKNRVGDMV